MRTDLASARVGGLHWFRASDGVAGGDARFRLRPRPKSHRLRWPSIRCRGGGFGSCAFLPTVSPPAIFSRNQLFAVSSHSNRRALICQNVW